MLTSQRIDTNSLFLTDELNALGVEVKRKVIVGDDRAMLANAARQAFQHSDIVIFTGGLGPTEDDLTRESVADALDLPLIFRQDLCDTIEERFRRRQRKMAEINRRQAYLIEGAEILANPVGTAVGQWIEHSGRRLAILLPGPPSEMKPMFLEQCLPRLAERLPAQVIRTRFYRVTGMTESDLDQLISPVYKTYPNPATTILASPGDIQIHLRARCGTEGEAEKLLAEVGDPIEKLLGLRLFSKTGDTLETVLAALLQQRHATLAVAESLTGGMLGERITGVPGISDHFLGGFLVYCNPMKQTALGVDPGLIEKFTAVSEEVARAMAEGARERTGATYAISTTGEAGPDSATGAPVGTVYIGLAGPEGTEAKRFNFPGDRTRVRLFAAQAALDYLRQHLS
jgi:nicotinamide-nucleotide amidase